MHNTIYAALAAVGALVLYVLILPFFISIRLSIQARKNHCQRPPMYPCDPWGISTVRQLLRADREQRLPDLMVDRMVTMSEKHGRVVSSFEARDPGGNIAVVTYEPKNIQAILATQFKDFKLPEDRINNFIPLLGPGIFAANGSRWEHSRALLRPQFVRDQVSEAACQDRHVANMIRALPAQPGEWTDLTDIQVLLFRLTLDSATDFLFGESVESQLSYLGQPGATTNEKPDEKDFAHAWDKGQWYLAKASRFSSFWWVVHDAEFKEMCTRVHKFAEHFVQLALNQKPSEKAAHGDNERYVFLEELSRQTQDPEELRHQLLNILLAGRDTTASLLSWMFRLLAQHPHIFNKLRETIIEQFGTYENPKEINFTTLKNSQYLQRVLSETLRLYPVVPVNSRQAVRDTTIPSGGGPDGNSPVFIPKGGLVIYTVHAMHRRPDIWGPTVDQFDPSRWENRKFGWEYLPFNGGPRVCIGQQFALTNAAYVTVKLLQRFDALDGSALNPVVKHGLTLTSCPGDGVRLRMRVAKQA